MKKKPAPDLKPCPLCGSTNLHIYQLYVTCKDCNLDGPYPQGFPIPLHAGMSSTETWNTRPRAPRKGAPVKEEPKHDLKPCPFCAETEFHVYPRYVHCKTCHSDGPRPPANPAKEWTPTKAWNTRRRPKRKPYKRRMKPCPVVK